MDKNILNAVEIELAVDRITGEPIIRIRHHDKSDEIAQVLVGLFVKGAKERGLKISNVSGFVEVGGDSHENYVISFNNK